MNNLFVYCEIEEGIIADVSLELLTKGRSLANELNCALEAVVVGSGLKDIEKQILPYGVDKLHVFDGEGLYPYTSLPHTSVLVNLFKEEQPQICLMGATVIGRDLGPRVSSALTSGLTADCTSLEIGDHEDKKAGKVYKNLLYQIRPAFGGNIVATIVNPEHRPHDGRTHFVTTAKRYDVDEYAIKYMVGHKISDITEKIYTKRKFDWLKQEIEKIP